MSLSERLKALADAAKGLLLWVVAPIVGFIAILLYYINKNKILQTSIDVLLSNNKTSIDKEKADVKDKEALNALDAYRKSKSDYLNGGGKL